MAEWVLEESEFYGRRFKQYQKKHPKETAAALNNLDTFVRTLKSGVKPALIQAGFIHREPHGVVAIDQRGAAKGSTKQTRLYVYVVEIEKVLYLITIGDKNTQKQDIKDCNTFVSSMRKEK